MKPPLRQIANQVSKVEVSWPATLPLPRIAPLMSKVAGMVPDLPSPISRSLPASLPNPLPRTAPLLPGSMITDINQLSQARFTPAPVSPAAIPEPIFESAVETIGAPAADFTRGILKLDFE